MADDDTPVRRSARARRAAPKATQGEDDIAHAPAVRRGKPTPGGGRRAKGKAGAAGGRGDATAGDALAQRTSSPSALDDRTDRFAGEARTAGRKRSRKQVERSPRDYSVSDGDDNDADFEAALAEGESSEDVTDENAVRSSKRTRASARNHLSRGARASRRKTVESSADDSDAEFEAALADESPQDVAEGNTGVSVRKTRTSGRKLSLEGGRVSRGKRAKSTARDSDAEFEAALAAGELSQDVVDGNTDKSARPTRTSGKKHSRKRGRISLGKPADDIDDDSDAAFEAALAEGEASRDPVGEDAKKTTNKDRVSGGRGVPGRSSGRRKAANASRSDNDSEYAPTAPETPVPSSVEDAPTKLKKKRTNSTIIEVPVPSTRPWALSESGDILKIVTWNVWSCRSAMKNGTFVPYIEKECPDILCIQETKMTDDAVADFPEIDGYDVHWNHSSKKGYSGVATFVRQDLTLRKGTSVSHVTKGIDEKNADYEGRAITVFLDVGLAVVNAYVPNSGGKLARLPYRTGTFEPAMRKYLNNLVERNRVVYCGDLNVAHEVIDIHNSKGNVKNAGHTPQERYEFSGLLASGSGWTDSFRALNPTTPGFTFFSRRFGPKLKTEGKGWRLDYHVLDSASFKEGIVADVFIRPEIEGSDHVPLVLEYRISLLRGKTVK